MRQVPMSAICATRMVPPSLGRKKRSWYRVTSRMELDRLVSLIG